MKFAVFVAFLALVALATAMASPKLTMGKFPRKPLTMGQASVLGSGQGRGINLEGNIPDFGEYFVELTVGTPPQKLNAQVDTGSSDLLVYSSNCVGCGDNRKYNRTASTTSQTVKCWMHCDFCDDLGCAFTVYKHRHGAQVTGPVLWDVLSFPGTDIGSTSIEFGAISTAAANFEPNGVDGIFGLSYSALSSWRGVPPFMAMSQQHNFPAVYSVCLAKNGGSLTFGYTAPASTKWTPIIQRRDYLGFIVNINGFNVSGQALGYKASDFAEALFDSGTTRLVLPKIPYNALVSHMKSMCATTNLVGVCNVPAGQSIFDGLCFPMTDDEVKKFPVITPLVPGFGGSLAINPHDYLIPGSSTPGSPYCWGVSAGEGGIPLLGQVAVQNQNIIYDMAQSRIGLAPSSTC